MFDRNSKFPRFIILMLLPITLIMLIGMFFAPRLVANAYFIALLVSVVYLLIDRHYGENITNYRLAFFLFDIINLIATIVVIYYEFRKESYLLNILMIISMIFIVLLILIDVVLVKNNDIEKKHSVFVGLVNLGFMICILTYFYNVSELFFIIDALIFEVSSIIIKIIIIFSKNSADENAVCNNENEVDIVSIIRAEEEGDFE